MRGFLSILLLLAFSASFCGGLSGGDNRSGNDHETASSFTKLDSFRSADDIEGPGAASISKRNTVSNFRQLLHSAAVENFLLPAIENVADTEAGFYSSSLLWKSFKLKLIFPQHYFW